MQGPRALIACFNPRSRGGSDAHCLAAAAGGQSFNPRSRGGSDMCKMSIRVVMRLFQSTLPRGERLECMCSW